MAIIPWRNWVIVVGEEASDVDLHCAEAILRDMQKLGHKSVKIIKDSEFRPWYRLYSVITIGHPKVNRITAEFLARANPPRLAKTSEGWCVVDEDKKRCHCNDEYVGVLNYYCKGFRPSAKFRPMCVYIIAGIGDYGTIASTLSFLRDMWVWRALVPSLIWNKILCGKYICRYYSDTKAGIKHTCEEEEEIIEWEM